MRPNRLLFALVLLAGTALAGGSALADEGHTVEVTATAGFGDDCGDTTRCWLIDKSGTIDRGATVNVTVVVPEDADTEHDLYVATSGYDKGGDSDTSNALAGTDGTVDPGEQTSFEFTVPNDADELYAWCDVGAHEQLGMYKAWSLGTTDSGTADDGHDHTHDDGTGDDASTTGDDGQQSSPAIGLIAALAGLALVAVAAGTRE